MNRIVIVGGPGSGKSTLAAYICDRKGFKHIELDSMFHKENWQPSDELEFQKKVLDAMGEADEGWVVDGGYRSQLNGVVEQEADALIYLNIPVALALARVLRRSIKRIAGRELLWGVNYESPQGAWSLLKWAKNSHEKRQLQTRKEGEDFIERGLVYKEFRSNKDAEKWIGKI